MYEMFIRCMQTDRINFMQFCTHILALFPLSTYFWDRLRILDKSSLMVIKWLKFDLVIRGIYIVGMFKD